MQNDAKRSAEVSLFTEILVPIRNVSHFDVFGANWLPRMVHTKSEAFGFLVVQIDCSGSLFSGLQFQIAFVLEKVDAQTAIGRT